MKDFYKTLGITHKASQEEIESIYRKTHPDKKGGDKEGMQRLNEAYEILKDIAKRKDYDLQWEVFHSSEKEVVPENIAGIRKAGHTRSFSQDFREEHQSRIIQYKKAPLSKRAISSEVESELHPIFTFSEKKALASSDDKLPAQGVFTPKIAVTLFLDFLKGNYRGRALDTLEKRLLAELSVNNSDRPWLKGMIEIVSMARNGPNKNLLLSIKKITDFTARCDEVTLSLTERELFISLFYNKRFRALFAYALDLHWNTHGDDLLNQPLPFDGRAQAKAFLEALKERTRYSHGLGFGRLMECAKLLSELEEALYAPQKEKKLDKKREKIFQLLDWVPSVVEKADKQILVNCFLQIGIHF